MKARRKEGGTDRGWTDIKTSRGKDCSRDNPFSSGFLFFWLPCPYFPVLAAPAWYLYPGCHVHD